MSALRSTSAPAALNASSHGEPARNGPQPLAEDVKRALREAFGLKFSDNPETCRHHGGDGTYHANRPPGGVVFAESTEDVVQLMRLSQRHGVPVTPYGAGTSLEGNVGAIYGGVCLDLSRMDQVLRVSADDLDCTVQAGVTRVSLNAYLRDTGLFFPVDPGANATLGGMAATRASGTNTVRYGAMRDNVMSLTVVTPDGRVVRTARRARKSAAGYDLTRLYLGSEGTLGVIVDVTLRLSPIPEAISAAVAAFPDAGSAVRTVIETVQAGIPVARAEFLDDLQMAAVNRWSKTDYPVADTLFLEFHGSPDEVKAQSAAVAAIAAANGGGDFRWAVAPEERGVLWKARHEAGLAAAALRPEGVPWATDVCVPISRLAECIEETKADLVDAPFPATVLGHVGDGNFHVVFVLDPSQPTEMAAASRINWRLVERALAMDGTCTGEHGVGVGKIDALRAELGQAVDLMAAVKQALDPRGLMNPGKIFRAA